MHDSLAEHKKRDGFPHRRRVDFATKQGENDVIITVFVPAFLIFYKYMLIGMQYYPGFLSSINGGRAERGKQNFFNSFYKINQDITLQIKK
jgi:hypothetical protein